MVFNEPASHSIDVMVHGEDPTLAIFRDTSIVDLDISGTKLVMRPLTIKTEILDSASLADEILFRRS